MTTANARLFVGNLKADVGEEDLRALFKPFGAVVDVEVILDLDTDVSRGFGFVQMADDAAASAALEKLNKSEFRGKRLRVKIAAPKRPAGFAVHPPVGLGPSAPFQPEPPASLAAATAPIDEAPIAAVPPLVAAPPATVEAPLTPLPVAEGPVATPPPVIAPSLPAPPPATRRPTRAVLTAVVIMAVVLVAAFSWLWGRPARTDAATVLIMPLDVMGQATGADYVGYAMAQALAVNLATVPELRVLPVPATAELAGRGATQRAETAAAAGAGRLVLGTLTRTERGVHVSITVVDAEENKILWGLQHDAREADDTALASTLARELARHFGARIPQRVDHVLNLTGGPAMAIAPETAAALDALRRGDVAMGLSATERLIARFPMEPAAAALRTHALLLQWDAGRSPATLKSFADSLAALEAMPLASAYAEFYRAYMLYGEGRDEEAVRRFTAILDHHELSPSARAWVLRYRAVGHQRMGQTEAALAELRESQQLDPTNAWTLSIMSEVLLEKGQPEQALVAAQQGQALAPNYWRLHQMVGKALSAMGKSTEAAEVFGRECERVQAQLPCARWAVELMRGGRREEAAKAGERAAGMPDTAAGLYDLACYRALAGDTAGALHALRRAVDAGLVERGMGTDSDLVSLQGMPEFQALWGIVKTRGRTPTSGSH